MLHPTPRRLRGDGYRVTGARVRTVVDTALDGQSVDGSVAAPVTVAPIKIFNENALPLRRSVAHVIQPILGSTHRRCNGSGFGAGGRVVRVLLRLPGESQQPSPRRLGLLHG